MSTRKLRVTPVCVAVHREGESPVFGEGTTHVQLEDEGGGAFVILRQFGEHEKEGELRFDVDELQVVAREAARMVRVCEAGGK